MTEPLPDEIDDALWEEACRRAAAIRQFRKRKSGQSTVATIADLASELGLSQASTYRLLKRFRDDGTVMSLVETKRGRRVGQRALDARSEEIIQNAIRKYYLQPTRPPVSQLVRDIRTDCAMERLKPGLNGSPTARSRSGCPRLILRRPSHDGAPARHLATPARRTPVILDQAAA